jgi:ATP-binding cassette subfamily B protein
MTQHGFTEEEFSEQFNLRLWRKLAVFARPHRAVLAVLMGTAIVLAVCDAFLNLVLGRIIDSAGAGQKDAMLGYALAYLGLVTVISTCVFVFINLAGRCSTGISHDIRKAAFAHLQQLHMAYYDRRPVGWLMARLTSDCQRFSSFISWGLLDLTWGVTIMLGISTIMILLNWRLALVAFSVLPVMLFVSVQLQKRILRLSRKVRKTNSQITASYNEGIVGVRTTKALVREKKNLDEFGKLTGDMYAQSVRSAILSSIYWTSVMTLASVGGALVLWRTGAAQLAGFISLGTMLAFIQYTAQFFHPIHELSHILTDWQAAQASAERILGLLETPCEVKDAPEVAAAIEAAAKKPASPDLACDGLPNRVETIEFAGVDFKYKEGQKVLSGFNLNVRAGQSVALVGPTGGGKTTIVSLLCRFYEPTAGEIRINGLDYRRRSLRWLQSNLGIVLQQPHLFSGSIRENIRYGRLSATDAEVEQAARAVRAHDFIEKMSSGYDTEVGEGGNRLSVGQKQLVSFARAVLADPQIFVMDEATSSVDTRTEQLIQDGLRAVLRGRTSFIVAHRLSTIRSADVILVIENGQIIEQGNHHQLIRLKGRYYELYTNQFAREKEFELMEQG